MEKSQRNGGRSTPSIIKGCWQMSTGHGGYPDRRSAVNDLIAFARAGITTFDCGDIYTGVEETIGEFLQQHAAEFSRDKLRVHTKLVPDLDALPTMNRHYVEAIIDRSLTRLGLVQLHRIQFHWWDFEIPGHLETVHILQDLQRSGKIEEIAVTNYDTAHLRELVESGVKIVSNQVQYSVLDRRPTHEMTTFCLSNSIDLLCYGTVAGGLLSEDYLGKKPPQQPYTNRSLTKYTLIVDELGGWDVLQTILYALDIVARKHDVSITDVATRYVLQQPAVGGVILGASSRRLPAILKATALTLDESDCMVIDLALAKAKAIPGDVYEIERVKGGPHAEIMRYNLNAQQ